MSQPLVSVLTPSFNQGRWLGDNLRSVASQTYSNIEHIVMDGGSTDDTIAVLRDARGRVAWRSEADRGQSHALNKALAASSGDIIGWLNSDDAYFSSDAVACVVRFFERHPSIDVVYGHAALVNADGLLLQMIWVPPFSYRLLGLHNFIIQPAAFVRRSALNSSIADEAYDSAMDRELWLRLGREHRFARISSVLAIDRHQSERKTLARPGLARADAERMVAKHGVPAGWWTRAAVKTLKIAFRLFGLSLLPQARGPLAFQAIRDSRRRLAIRQVASTRSAMPMGSMTAPVQERSAP